MIISDVTSGALQNDSDDDVIEVVRDEAPIEILSDDEEQELAKSKTTEPSVATQNFHFSSLMISDIKDSDEKMDTSEAPDDPLRSVINVDSIINNSNEPEAPLIQAVTVPVIAHSSNAEIIEKANSDPQVNVEHLSINDNIGKAASPVPIITQADDNIVQTRPPDKPNSLPNDQVPIETSNKVG